MITARILLIGIIITSVYCCADAQESFPYRGEARYESNDGQGRVQIALEKTKLRRDTAASVDYTFFNENGSYWIYNWNFISLIPLPGKLAIYNSEKHYIGDLIQWEGGSRKGVGNDDWLFLYGPCHIGRPIGFRVGYVPLTKYGTTRNQLPPGTYFIQLILYKAYFSINPSRIEGDPKPQWYDTSEAARSNVIEIQIVS